MKATSYNIDRIIAEIGVSVVEVRDLKESNGTSLLGNRLRIEAYHLLRDAQRKLRVLHDQFREQGD